MQFYIFFRINIVSLCSGGRVLPCHTGKEDDSGCMELCRDLWSPQPNGSTHCCHVNRETKVAQAQGKPAPRSHSSHYATSHPRHPNAEMMQDVCLSPSLHPPGTIPATSTSQPVPCRRAGMLLDTTSSLHLSYRSRGSSIEPNLRQEEEKGFSLLPPHQGAEFHLCQQ